MSNFNNDQNNLIGGNGFFPTSQPNQFATGGNLHDTFKVDRYGNLYDTHTTIDLGNNQKIHMPWDPTP